MIILQEKKCLSCGRIFTPTNSWVFRRETKDGNVRYFCSYSCTRKYDKVQEEKEKARALSRKKGRYATTEEEIQKRKALIRTYMEQGLTNRQISEKVGLSIPSVRSYREDINIELYGEEQE